MAPCDDQDWQLTRKTASERNKYMFNNALMSDVKFTCGDTTGKCFYAHKYVLATSSPVFYNKFYGELAEAEPVIDLPDTDDESMEEFLRFIYTDQSNMNPKNALTLMYLANKYKVPSLTEKCTEELMKDINAENVATILEKTLRFEEKELEEKCWEVVEQETSNVVASEGFLQISQPTLTRLLERKQLNVQEIDLFQTIIKWCDNQCVKNSLETTGENRRSAIGDALYQISFVSMRQKEFAENVPKSGLLTADEMNGVYAKFNGFDKPELRWKIPKRCNNYTKKFHRLARCITTNVSLPESQMWHYTIGKPDSLCFSFSDFIFHGVRLFGDTNNSNYDVTLEVKDAKVSGTYTSGKDNDGVLGFDVMLPKPVVIEQSEIVKMSAVIKGPNSSHIQNGLESVEQEGVKVTFSQSDESTNGTDAVRGQFYQLIVSFM